MFTSKEQILALKTVYTKNPFSLASIYVGSHFSPLKRKIKPISTLVHRALIICTKRRLNGKIERIKKILLDNGYPRNVINAQIAKKIAELFTFKRFGPEKCPVYLRVPWIGKHSTKLQKKCQNRLGKLLWFRQRPLSLYVKAHAACSPQRSSTYHLKKLRHI